MKEKICYIIGAGELSCKISPVADSYIIAADGGYEYLKKENIKPDLLIGDFDSIKQLPEKEEFIKYPVMKDDTDMMLAIKQGVEKGYSIFYIYGGMGGRLDHTFANVQALAYISAHSAKGFLIDNNIVVTAITNDEIRFKENAEGIVSVFSNTTLSEGVTIDGLQYAMKNGTVDSSFPIGVSNHFIGNRAKISVENGTLVILWYGTVDNVDL